MANFGPFYWYTREGAAGWTLSVTAWSASGVIAAGVLRRQTAPAVGSERVFVATIAGTSGGTEPSWVLTKGAKTTDGGVTWMECTGQPAVNGWSANSPTTAQCRSLAITLGYIIYHGTNGSVQICTTAGTTAAGTPAFTATAGATLADGTATWTCLGLASGFASFAAPHMRIGNNGGASWAAAGDTIYFASDHAESQGVPLTITLPGTLTAPNNLLCIDPATGVLTAGSAGINTLGNSAATLNGCFYAYGLNIFAGSSSGSTGHIVFGNGAYWQKYERGAFILGQSGTPSIQIGRQAASSGATVEWLDCQLQLSAVGQTITVYNGDFLWRNTAAISFTLAGSVPTNLFTPSTGGGDITLEGLNLNTMGAAKNLVAATAMGHNFFFNNCRINPSVTVAGTPTGMGPKIYINGTDSGANSWRQDRWSYTGNLVTDNQVVRSSGASDGTTGFSWRMTSYANVVWTKPLNSLMVTAWNSITAADVTVVIRGIINRAAPINNDDVWMTAQWLGDASYPIASTISTTKVDITTAATALTADTASAWDASAALPARANTTPYTVTPLSIIKVASNPGRVFFCIQAGTSAGTEPAGYATATDGTVVTDNTAQFRAGVRFALSATLSTPQPQMAGPIYVTVSLGRASVASCWIDPEINAS